MNRLILGIDAGNHKAKVVGMFGIDSFKTNICEWFERDVEEVFGKDDMEFIIGNRKGFAGSIAEIEDEFGNGAMYGDSKAHEDTKIRVLLAIYRYLNKYCPHIKRIALVTGQPIKKHNNTEKEKIINMLVGEHEFVVNGKSISFTIENVLVAPEGSGSFWVNPQDGTIRIIDVGSGTVNAATIIDKRHVNNMSTTFNFGIETVNNKEDLSGIARGIIRNTTRLKWIKTDKVIVCGGISEEIFPLLADHYVNAEIAQPSIMRGNGVVSIHPVFANAVGFYNLAKGVFK